MNDLKCVLLSKERQIRIGDAEHTYKIIYFIGASLSEPHSLVAHRVQAQSPQCIMVRTYTKFSYSDLNPTGLSPRTGYFENFQSYSDIQ